MMLMAGFFEALRDSWRKYAGLFVMFGMREGADVVLLGNLLVWERS